MIFFLTSLSSVAFGLLALLLKKLPGNHLMNSSFISSMEMLMFSLNIKLILITNFHPLSLEPSYQKKLTCLICTTTRRKWCGKIGHKLNLPLSFPKKSVIVISSSLQTIVSEIISSFTLMSKTIVMYCLSDQQVQVNQSMLVMNSQSTIIILLILSWQLLFQVKPMPIKFKGSLIVRSVHVEGRVFIGQKKGRVRSLSSSMIWTCQQRKGMELNLQFNY